MNSLLLERALKLLEQYPLCSSCLGRQFALLGYGLSNSERGDAIKTLLLMRTSRGEPPKERDIKLISLLARSGFKPAQELAEVLNIKISKLPCYICEDKLSELRSVVPKIVNDLTKIEYNTFLVGSIVPKDVLKREEEVRISLNLPYAESIKREINREVGKLIQSMTGKTVEFKNPDILILIDLENLSYSIKIFPLYIYGRYRKLRRGIPQSRWPCKHCFGKGCEVCGYRGKRYPFSIEELISNLIVKASRGKYAILHAAGREDIDARMLGRGRPFILEVIEPIKRNINLKEIEMLINYSYRGLVEVYDLKVATSDLVRYFKLSSKVRRKLYRAIIKVDRLLSDIDISKLEDVFEDKIIYQRTPLRVIHRRPDRIREKRVYRLKVLHKSKEHLEVLILAQGGLYVKELISGDNGRTSPSIEEELGINAECVVLDVIEVEG